MSGSLRFILIFTLTCESIAWAAPFQLDRFGDDPGLVGHNLTPTTYTAHANTWTIGTFAIGYGINDNVMLATSPWLVAFYNMPNAILRFGTLTHGWFDQWAWEFDYFHTYKYGLNNYQQISVFNKITGTTHFSDYYSLHASVSYQYFFDDTRPFSLRLVPGNNTKYELAIGTLHEIRLSPYFGMFLEIGVLGLNYASPYCQYGASLFWKWSGGYLQLGLSRSVPIGEPHFPFMYRLIWEDTFTNTISIVHPEIQLQFTF